MRKDRDGYKADAMNNSDNATANKRSIEEMKATIERQRTEILDSHKEAD